MKVLVTVCPTLLVYRSMKFTAYMAFSFITFFRILLVSFLFSYIWLYVLYASV
jgi:hypothetical protein